MASSAVATDAGHPGCESSTDSMEVGASALNPAPVEINTFTNANTQPDPHSAETWQTVGPGGKVLKPPELNGQPHSGTSKPEERPKLINRIKEFLPPIGQSAQPAQVKQPEHAATTAQQAPANLKNNQNFNQLLIKPLSVEIWERTVMVTLPPRSGVHNREIFKDHLRENGLIGELEAFGPMAAPHLWNFTFRTMSAKQRFINLGNFRTSNDLEARVHHPKQGNKSNPNRHLVRIHWVPYHIPMDAVLEPLIASKKLKIISSKFETVRDAELGHVRSLVRAVVVETTNEDDIPNLCRWSFRGQSGTMLLTMRGRLFCLKCNKQGHLRKDCTTPYCTKCRTAGHITADCGNSKLSYSAALKPTVEPDTEEHMDLAEEDADHESAFTQPIPPLVSEPGSALALPARSPVPEPSAIVHDVTSGLPDGAKLVRPRNDAASHAAGELPEQSYSASGTAILGSNTVKMSASADCAQLTELHTNSISPQGEAHAVQPQLNALAEPPTEMPHDHQTESQAAHPKQPSLKWSESFTSSIFSVSDTTDPWDADSSSPSRDVSELDDTAMSADQTLLTESSRDDFLLENPTAQSTPNPTLDWDIDEQGVKKRKPSTIGSNEGDSDSGVNHPRKKVASSTIQANANINGKDDSSLLHGKPAPNS
jgi:hypothetical protein